MKAKELIAILEKNPDFEVVVTICDGGGEISQYANI